MRNLKYVIRYLQEQGKEAVFVSIHRRFVAEALGLTREEIDQVIAAGEAKGVLFYDDDGQYFILPRLLEKKLKAIDSIQRRRALCAAFYRSLKDSMSSDIFIMLKNGKTYSLPQHHILEWIELFPEIDVGLEIRRYQNMTRHTPAKRPATPEQVGERIFQWLDRARMLQQEIIRDRQPSQATAKPNVEPFYSQALRAFPKDQTPKRSPDERQRQRQMFRAALFNRSGAESSTG